MAITATELSPLVAIIAGILILIIPRLLNYIVALYLIFFGLVQLNQSHHWVHFGMDLHRTPLLHLAAALGLLNG